LILTALRCYELPLCDLTTATVLMIVTC
jgi:hypothetical protein